MQTNGEAGGPTFMSRNVTEESWPDAAGREDDRAEFPRAIRHAATCEAILGRWHVVGRRASAANDEVGSSACATEAMPEGADATPPERSPALVPGPIASSQDDQFIAGRFDGSDLRCKRDGSGQDTGRASASSPGGSRRDLPSGSRLYTAFITDQQEDGWMQAFAAAVTSSPIAFWQSLSERYGRPAALAADVLEGFDPTLPLVEALVSSAMADMLSQIAGDPASPLAAGLDIRIEQRFLS